MVNGEAGKGDTPRPVNWQKWDEAWKKIDASKRRKPPQRGTHKRQPVKTE